MNDYYYVLGISRNANQDEIKTAYRKLSKKFHPDLNGGDKFFEDRFKEIQTAYETLTDFSKKSRYDSLLNNNIYSNTQQSYSQKSYSEPPPKPKAENKHQNNSKKKNTNNKSNSKILAYLFLGFIGILSISIFFDEKSKSSINPITTEQEIKPTKKYIPAINTEPIEEYTYYPSETNKRWLNGELFGNIKQFDIDENWDLNLTIEKKGRDIFGRDNYNFKIDYPSLNCGGDWKIIAQIDNKIEFREKIKYGNDICGNSGKVVLEKKNNEIIYSYYFPNDNTLNAKGVLSRTKSNVNDNLTNNNSTKNNSNLISKKSYIGNQLKNGASPLDKCFGKGVYSGQAYLIFKNSNRTDAIVCLVKQYDKKTIRNEYIRAGADFKMSRIPSGNYFIKVYYGNDWNPEKLNFCNIKGAFENNVHFSKSDNIGDIITIENSSYSYTTGSITLYTVENGNMSSENINESEFFQE